MPVEAMVEEDDLDSSVDAMVMESKDDDMEAVGAEPSKQQNAGVAISAASQSASQMDEEASQKGYGKAYAAFNGGREGLEACAASKTHLISSHLISSHLISSHLISSHLISTQLNSPHPTPPCLIASYVVSSHLTSSHLTSSHLTSSHLTFFHLWFWLNRMTTCAADSFAVRHMHAPLYA